MQKCDGAKPECGTCVRKSRKCSYATSEEEELRQRLLELENRYRAARALPPPPSPLELRPWHPPTLSGHPLPDFRDWDPNTSMSLTLRSQM